MPVMKKVCLAVVAFVSASLAAATEAAVVAPTPTGLRSGASASPATTAPSSTSAPTKPTASTAVDVAKGANMKNFTYGGGSAKECTAAYEAAFLSVDRDSPDFAAQVQAAISQLPDGTNGAIDCRDSQLYKYKPPANPAVVGSGYGLNSKTGWEYSLQNDCYRSTGVCPDNMYCQVNWREQYFPFSEGLINRGRCISYAQEGQVCNGDEAESGPVLFHEYKGWTAPPAICAPGLACAKDIVTFVAPTCVKVKSEILPCVRAWPTCAGVDAPASSNGTGPSKTGDGGGNDVEKPLSPEASLDWSSVPCGSNRTCVTRETGGFSKEMLEACVRWSTLTMDGGQGALVSTQESVEAMSLATRAAGAVQNTASNSFTVNGSVSPEADAMTANGGQAFSNMARFAMDLGTFNHERVAEIANKVLEPIWPYPVCDDNDKSNGTECTSFPLLPMSTDEAEVILGKIPSRYMCDWGVAHTIAENGDAVITPEQGVAFRGLINLYQQALSCQLCRTNFAHIVNYVGMPQGQLRETYAAWWWSAHNNANEHVVAVHSPSSPLSPGWVYDWTNPQYENPWYTPRSTARKIWQIKGKNKGTKAE